MTRKILLGLAGLIAAPVIAFTTSAPVSAACAPPATSGNVAPNYCVNTSPTPAPTHCYRELHPQQGADAGSNYCAKPAPVVSPPNPFKSGTRTKPPVATTSAAPAPVVLVAPPLAVVPVQYFRLRWL